MTPAVSAVPTPGQDELERIRALARRPPHGDFEHRTDVFAGQHNNSQDGQPNTALLPVTPAPFKLKLAGRVRDRTNSEFDLTNGGQGRLASPHRLRGGASQPRRSTLVLPSLTKKHGDCAESHGWRPFRMHRTLCQ